MSSKRCITVFPEICFNFAHHMLIPRLGKPYEWFCDTYAPFIGSACKVNKLACKFTEVSAAPLLCELPTGATSFLASMLKILHALTTAPTRLARPPRVLPPLCPASMQWINVVALSWASSNVRFCSPSVRDAYPGQLKSCLVQSLHVLLLDVGPDVISWQRQKRAPTCTWMVNEIMLTDLTCAGVAQLVVTAPLVSFSFLLHHGFSSIRGNGFYILRVCPNTFQSNTFATRFAGTKRSACICNRLQPTCTVQGDSVDKHLKSITQELANVICSISKMLASRLHVLSHDEDWSLRWLTFQNLNNTYLNWRIFRMCKGQCACPWLWALKRSGILATWQCHQQAQPVEFCTTSSGLKASAWCPHMVVELFWYHTLHLTVLSNHHQIHQHWHQNRSSYIHGCLRWAGMNHPDCSTTAGSFFFSRIFLCSASLQWCRFVQPQRQQQIHSTSLQGNQKKTQRNASSQDGRCLFLSLCLIFLCCHLYIFSFFPPHATRLTSLGAFQWHLEEHPI